MKLVKIALLIATLIATIFSRRIPSGKVDGISDAHAASSVPVGNGVPDAPIVIKCGNDQICIENKKKDHDNMICITPVKWNKFEIDKKAYEERRKSFDAIQKECRLIRGENCTKYPFCD